MPILAPLADFANVPRSIVVTAYQSASGLVNLVTPTSAVIMGGLALTKVGYNRYLQFVWPFALAGILAPGISQSLFTLAIRDAGPSRTSATVGMAPLFAVTFAVVLLGEPLVTGIAFGAILIVAGGLFLANEPGRPAHVKTIGLLFALAATLVFASRDTIVRWVAIDSNVAPELAISATLLAGALTMLAAVLVGRRRLSFRSAHAFIPPGLLLGLSYICLYEAFFRGKLSVVAPLVATETLWGVGLSAVFLRRSEAVGRRLAVGACFVVAGGILIGLSR
jgi:drug/metabolite transporter (DMT)-like permease